VNDDFLSVKPGDLITADIWNKMAASADRSKMLFGGENARVNMTPHGTLVNAKFVGGYSHPWRVLPSIDHLVVNPGTINNVMPTIKGVPLDSRPAPQLDIDTGLYDQSGMGWIAAILTCDNAWITIKHLEIKQVANITREDSTAQMNPQLYLGYAGFSDQTARYPIARIQKIPSPPGEDFGYRLWQIAMFNLQWKAKPPAGPGMPGSQVSRHFYWPV
jgi:hypothetical protein